MKIKSIIFALILIFSIPFCFAESSSSSLNWASKRYVDNNFAKLGGDVYFNSINVSEINYQNITQTQINVTGNIEVEGNVTFESYLCDSTNCYSLEELNATADLSNYVPYTGANSNVDLESYDLTTTGKATLGNLDIDMQDGDVTSSTLSFYNSALTVSDNSLIGMQWKLYNVGRPRLVGMQKDGGTNEILEFRGNTGNGEIFFNGDKTNWFNDRSIGMISDDVGATIPVLKMSSSDILEMGTNYRALIGGIERTYPVLIYYGESNNGVDGYLSFQKRTPTGNDEVGLFDVDGNFVMPNDNKKIILGSERKFEIYSDGLDVNFNNSVDGGEYNFYNGSGWAVLNAHDFVSHTFNQSEEPLEMFTKNQSYYDVWTSVIDKDKPVITYKTLYLINYSYEGNDFQEAYETEEERNVREIILNQENIDFINSEVIVEVIKYPYTKLIKGQSSGKLLEDLKGMAIDLNKNVDLDDNLTTFHTSTLAEHYITNTTKEPATIQKIETLWAMLETMTYEEVKDFILTDEGKLATTVLMDYELSKYGSYNLEGIGHTNRGAIILLMWQLRKQEDRLSTIESDLCASGYQKYC